MIWTKYELEFDHPSGEPTRFFMQTDGDRYVLSEHPENRGPHVEAIATKYGDDIVQNGLDVDRSIRPENARLFVERKDGRFDQWEAKTTKEINVALETNRYEGKAIEWGWKNSTQHNHKDLEQKLGARLEGGGQAKGQQSFAEEQNKAMRETPLPKTEQSEQLRQAANPTQEKDRGRR